MKRIFTAGIVFLAVAVSLVSCSSSGQGTSQTMTSGIKFRAFVSNPLFPVTGGGGSPVIEIVDASKDMVSSFRIPLATQGLLDVGRMALSPNRQFTLAYSPSNNMMAVISNAAETIATGPAGSTLPSIALPAQTDSFFYWIDNITAFVAMPAAPVLGSQPGLVERIDTGTSSVSAKLAIPGAHFLAESHNGNTILAMSDALGTVTVIFPSLIDSSTQPTTPICCFDHPVGAVFSADDNTAYILECGAECGGVQAAITPVDLTTNAIGTPVVVDGATTALMNGTNLYVAGTPPTPLGGNTCAGTTTSATSCGRLDVVDLNTLTVTNSAIITDGYHDDLQLASNGQMFVGATRCTNIPSSGTGEVRGCLSIYDVNTGNVVVPAQSGDVTGIQPITGRNVVYVCQGGALRIFDTTTDHLLVFPSNQSPPSIVGQAVDVKLVDGAP